jgi:hypothetical protein
MLRTYPPLARSNLQSQFQEYLLSSHIVSALEAAFLNPGQSQQQPITKFRGDHTRKIWQGELSWKSPHYDSYQKEVVHSIVCTVSTQIIESSQVQTVCSDSWPKKLTMQTIPKGVVQQIVGSNYLRNTRSVLFDFMDNPAKSSLTEVLNHGYACCVHFHSSEDKKCDIRVLILLFSPADNNYWGYIPNEQDQFIDELLF